MRLSTALYALYALRCDRVPITLGRPARREMWALSATRLGLERWYCSESYALSAARTDMRVFRHCPCSTTIYFMGNRLLWAPRSQPSSASRKVHDAIARAGGDTSRTSSVHSLPVQTVSSNKHLDSFHRSTSQRQSLDAACSVSRLKVCPTAQRWATGCFPHTQIYF